MSAQSHIGIWKDVLGAFTVGLLGVLVPSCESIVPPDQTTQLDPRKLEWTVDSLLPVGNGNQLSANGLWGASAEDMYLVAHSDVRLGKLWHYDGHSWSISTVPEPQVGSQILQLDAMGGSFGGSGWIVGSSSYINPLPPPVWIDSSFVLANNHSEWSILKYGGGPRLRCVYAIDQSGFWAGGDGGVMVQYENSEWRYTTFPHISIVSSIAQSPNGNICAIGYTPLSGGSNAYVYAEYDGNDWIGSDSTSDSPGANQRFGYGLFEGDGTLYSGGHGVSSYQNGRWTVLESFGDDVIVTVLPLLNQELIAGGTGRSLHYLREGSWTSIPLPITEQIVIRDMWTDGATLFIAAHLTSLTKTYIIRGE